MKTSLKNKIVSQIQSQQLQPKERWKFIVQEIALWLGTIISLLLASLAAGSFIFQSVNSAALPSHIVLWFGFIRIALSALFIVLAIYQVLRIAQGYKRSRRMYVIIGLLVVVGIGSLFFAARITGTIESRIGSSGLVNQAQKYWSLPKETGLLAAELIEITNDGYLLMQGFDNRTHIVDTRYIDRNEQDIFIDFLRVKTVGYYDNGIFYPCAVAPWELKQTVRESRSDYRNIRNGNIQFSKGERNQKNFNSTFERKTEIVRTNSC